MEHPESCITHVLIGNLKDEVLSIKLVCHKIAPNNIMNNKLSHTDHSHTTVFQLRIATNTKRKVIDVHHLYIGRKCSSSRKLQPQAGQLQVKMMGLPQKVEVFVPGWNRSMSRTEQLEHQRHKGPAGGTGAYGTQARPGTATAVRSEQKSLRFLHPPF